MEEQIRRVLDEWIRPGVQADGGDIELVEVIDGVVRLRMTGACEG